MVRRILASVVGVSTVLVLSGSFAAAQVPQLPKGSKVFIASMDGLETYMRRATSAVDFPLVFVRTRAEADYELTGTTREVRPEKAAVNNVPDDATEHHDRRHAHRLRREGVRTHRANRDPIVEPAGEPAVDGESDVVQHPR